MSQTADIVETVVSQAKRLEEMDDPDELDPMTVRVIADLDGRAREFIAVMTVGGPNIEVNLTRGYVDGSWAGDTHRTHFRNDELAEALERRYLHRWEDT